MPRQLQRFLALLCAPLLWVLAFSAFLPAQSTGSLSGTITDPSGAILPGTPVSLASKQGKEGATATSDGRGFYQFRNLSPGAYTLTVNVAGFAPYLNDNIAISGTQPLRLNIVVKLADVDQQVEVSSDAPHVDLTAEGNTSTVTIGQKELDSLSDDPDELQADLLALAGPSVGPNGGQLYVDGFTIDGELPPKNAIRQIKVNQNPFSAQYDRLGYGRIEIITKPGGTKMHGRVSLSGNTMAFDTRDTFSHGTPGYYSFLSSSDISGPLGKNASYFLNYQHRNIANNDVVSASVLDANQNQVPFNQTLTAPNRLDVGGPRVDIALTPNNFLNVSYQLNYQDQQNLGIGQFDLPTQGYSMHTNTNVIRANDTQMVGLRFVNQLSFQGQEQRYTVATASSSPEIQVISAFTGGGNTQGALNYHHHHVEVDDVATYSLARHTFTFGGRLRTVSEPYYSPGNFNGTFIFSSLSNYAAKTPRQFTITTGNAFTRIFSEDVGVYFLDDWRVRNNLLFSYGLRFETQNYIHDKADWAPRISIAYGLGRKNNPSPKTVLRAGWGLFFDRFNQQLQLQAQSLNGVIQTEYLVTNPTFYPNVPSLPVLIADGAVPTVYQTQPNLHAPYTLQTAVGVERQISKAITLSLTYLNSRGIHQLISNNINAPLPGTYNPAVANSGIRPSPAKGNIYEYESNAIFKQSQIITNFNVRASRGVSLFGFYSYGSVNSDTDGAGSFPSNPYNIAADYGRTAFDRNQHASVGGSIALKYGIQLSPLANFQSGAPFNITLGQDLVGSTIFNQRPSFATASTPPANVVATKYGTFNSNPGPNDKLIPTYYGTGPNNFVFNLRVGKTIALGKRTSEHAASVGGGDTGGGGAGAGGFRPGTNNQASGGGSLGGRGLGGSGGSSSTTTANRQFALSLSAEGRNIFNEVNYAAPVGTITSPKFGQSNALAGGVYSFSGTNRRIDFQVTLAF